MSTQQRNDWLLVGRIRLSEIIRQSRERCNVQAVV